MDNKQNEQILGLNLNVSQEFIANAIRNAVNLAIANTLDEKDKVLQEIVNAALSTKVDAHGKISTYSSDNRYNFVEYFVRNALMEETKEVLKEIVAERKDEIHKLIKKQIVSSKFVNQFCGAFCDGIVGAIGNEYHTFVNVSFEKRESRY